MQLKAFKSQASRRVLTILVMGALSPFATQAHAAQAPSFTPTGEWTVGSTQLSNVRGLKTMALPCVVANEFNNGFVMRFSGGGGEFLAMAMDFRQDVFKQGRKYDAMLSVGDGYVQQVTATAFTPSTLIFNLRPLKGFYGAVHNGSTLELDIDGNVLAFDLGQLSAAFPGLEACAKGNAAPVIEPILQAKVPVAAVEQEEVVAIDIPIQPTPLPPAVAEKQMPLSFDDIVQEADAQKPAEAAPVKSVTLPKEGELVPRPPMAAVPERRVFKSVADATAMTAMPGNAKPEKAARVSKAETFVPIVDEAAAPAPADIVPPTNIAKAVPVSIPAPVSSPVPIPAPNVWEAKAGEDIKIVLSRWSERAGYDLDWQSTMDGKVVQDLQMSGPFENAVSQLLAENSAAMGMNAHVETTGGDKKDIMAGRKASPEPKDMPPAVHATIPALHADWSAQRGANIQSVIDNWAQKAGVRVVWQDYMDFSVKAPVDAQGSFESALQGLLDQYAPDSQRPVAQLNVDPDTGERTLLMNLDHSG